MGVESGEQDSCNVSFNYLRERKTGPCIPLVIVRCITHNVSFTIYPPGHVPYGRESLVDIALDGFQIQAELETDTIFNAFEGSLFDSALKASQGLFYPKEGPYELPTICYDTQLNQIKKSALLLGISAPDQALGNEYIAETLNIPRQFQIGQSSHSTAWNSKKTGQAILRLLEKLPQDCLFERLVCCGFIHGIWPPLYIWNTETKMLYQSAFCQRINYQKTGITGRAPPQ